MGTTAQTTYNVFITGATTDVGRELTRQLTGRGHHVTGQTSGMAGAVQVRADGGLPAFSDPLRVGELKSMMLAAQADVVIHALPQIANDFPQKDTRWDYAGQALEAVHALLEAAGAVGVKYAVLLSYAFVYGDQHGAEVTEATEAEGHGLAGLALEAERALLDSAIPGCVLRVGCTYGPMSAGMMALADVIRFGRSAYLGDGLVNWVYASDVAAAAALAVEKQPVDEVYNIAAQVASGADFAGMLADQLGLPHPGTVNALLALSRTSEMQRSLLGMALKLNCDKAQRELGWSPKYDFKSGLDHALLTWRAGEQVSG
ncbi:MAG: NAD(P)-dependent oxidoreductase [Anaerolineae bacterium]|nr:NAD(P)-dependent oxidoreductase [Anaerolineae bacterium]